MNTNIEKEYKTLVSKEKFELLLANFSNFENITQINHYYDDDNNILKKNKMSLRIREFIHNYECTIKISIDKNTKHEINFECSSLDLNNIDELKLYLKDYDLSTIKEKGKLETYRRIYRDQYGELCFDVNKYNNITDYEIEYEQINECPDFLGNFINILKKADIEYQPSKPKMQRCLETVSCPNTNN